MTTQHDKASGFQFTIASLFTITTVAAVCFVIAFALPPGIAGPANFVFVLVGTAGWVALIVYGSGNTRAFAIGATLPPAVMSFHYMAHGFWVVVDGVEWTMFVTVPWVASVMAGLLCVYVRVKNRGQ